MGANPNRISSPFPGAKTAVRDLRLTESAQVSGVAPRKAPEPATARRKPHCAIAVPSPAQLRTGPPDARERIRRPLATHPLYRKDSPR